MNDRIDLVPGDEDPLDEGIRALAEGYNEPPIPPREEMWAAIGRTDSGRKADEQRTKHGRTATRRFIAAAAGMAALVMLGIGIGRMTTPDQPDSLVVTSAEPPSRRAAEPPTPFELVAARHLSQAEVFLTLFRASVRSGQVGEVADGAARELLLSNRLLLDSPVSEDARMRGLLEDLELVLAQIAQLPAEGTRADPRLITDGMDNGNMLTRLRLVTSTGAAATLRQGAL